MNKIFFLVSLSFLFPLQSQMYDVLVLGGGPAGLAAPIEIARAKYKVAVISQEFGGQLNGSHLVENIPSVASKPGHEIMTNLQQQVVSFGTECIEDTIVAVDFSQEGAYTVTTQDHGILTARAIIIATGSSPKKLGIPGEQEFWGRGVSSCAVCDCFLYQNKEVVVVGGGDSAIEEAFQLAEYADKVTILVRRDQMRASDWGQEKISEYKKVSIVYSTEVVEILGDDEQGVISVMLRNTKTGEFTSMKTDGVFLAIGHTPNSALFKDWLHIDKQGYIVLTGRSQATTIPGVFVAGDVCDPWYKKAYIAEGHGGQAGLEAVNYMRMHS